jgi:hypothetical protein
MKIMCSHQSSSSTVQTLEELDFDRGLWSAACDGDLKRCKELLQVTCFNYGSKMTNLSPFTKLHYLKREKTDFCRDVSIGPQKYKTHSLYQCTRVASVTF